MNSNQLGVAIFLLLVRSAWSAEPPAASELSADVIAVTKANNEFATQLYARLGSDKSKNLFFSPYSISTAMAMTYAGADGKTKAEMMDVLNFPQDESALHSGFKSLQSRFTSGDPRSGFQLHVANRLWGQKGTHFLPEFLSVTKSHYAAELGQLDFKQTEVARKSINSWIEQQTDRKIQNLIAPGVLTEDTRLVLTNAISFKSRWNAEFRQKYTSDEPFHISETQKIPVPTMKRTGFYHYAETEHAQAIELPYVKGSAVSMFIILPKARNGLKNIEEQLSNENLHEWFTQLKPANVELHLPKFKLTSEFRLNDVLKSMGMPLAFSKNADFSRIATQERLVISAVIHKALVNVDEGGTEAAASTTTEFVAVSVPTPFLADHPFLFLIRDNQTKSILFLGRVVNPRG